MILKVRRKTFKKTHNMNADEKVEHTGRKTSRKARVKDILEENCINCNRVHRHGFLELHLL